MNRFLRNLLACWLLLSSVFTAISQGYQFTPYGAVRIVNFGNSICQLPFEIEIVKTFGPEIDGEFTVIFDDEVFALDDKGDFVVDAAGVLKKAAQVSSHATAVYKFQGSLKQGYNDFQFEIRYEGLFNTQTITLIHTLSTPQLLVISGGNLSDYFESKGGPVKDPGSNGYATGAQFLVVNGQLNIDTDYGFGAGSVLTLLEGSKLTVKAGVILRLYSTMLHGCDVLWGGVEVESGAGLNIDGELQMPTVIRDAVVGITLKNGSYFASFRSLLLHNGTGLLTPPNNGVRQQISFDCWGMSIVGGTLLNGQQAEFGLHLYDLNEIQFSFNLGGVPLVNSLRDCRTGIRLHNSDIRMHRFFFRNMSEYGIWADQGSRVSYDGISFGPSSVGVCAGALIDFVEPNVPLPDFASQLFDLFEQMPVAVRVSQSDLEITRASMRYVNTGIICEPGILNITGIVENCIVARMRGIVISGFTGARGDIVGNNISVNGPFSSVKGYGIGLFNSVPQSTTDDWVIFNNRIEVCARAAITGVDFHNIKVRGNPLIRNHAPLRPAVSITGGINNEIECNDLIEALGDGVRLESSRRADLSCNDVQSGQNALLIVGDCSQSRVRGNELSGDQLALAYGTPDISYAETGVQRFCGNKFYGGAELLQVYNFSISDDIVESSQYRVNEIAGTAPCSFMPAHWPYWGAIGNAEWFLKLEDIWSCNFFCPSDCVFIPGVRVDEIDERDERIRDTLWGVGLPHATQWELRRALYRRLKEMETVPADFVNFVSAMESGSEGIFYQADQSIGQYLASLTATHSQISSLVMQRDSLYALMDALEPWIRDESGWHPDTTAFSLRIYLSREIASINIQIQQIRDNARSDLMVLSAGLLADASGCVVYEMWECHHKVMLLYQLEGLTGGLNQEPDSALLTSVRNIAIQCPLEGGEAVYKARAVLAILSGELIDSDSVCILAENRSRLQIIANHTRSGIKIAPNPTNLHFQVEAPMGMSLCELRIYDLRGRVTSVQHFMGKGQTRATISTVGWNPGMYIVVAQTTDGSLYPGRVLVHH